MAKRRVFSLRKAALALAGAALTALAPMPVLAAQPGSALPGLATIVVTAEKISQNVQTVPLSMSTFTAPMLQQQAVTSFFDYATRVPNMAFGMSNSGVSTARTIAIRGVSGDETTGFYINDVPVPASIDPRVLDLERIEVLRGPQGTLYGARSMGGTVRLITKKPDFRRFSGDLHVGIGDTWNTVKPNYTGDAVLNIPLIRDRVALRVSGFYAEKAGFLSRRFCTNPATAGITCFPRTTDPKLTTTLRNIYQTDEYGGSAALTIRATRNFTVTPWVMVQRTGYNGFPMVDVNSANNRWGYPYPQWTLTGPPALPILAPHDFVQGRFFNVPEGGYDYWHLYSLTAKWKNPIGELSSSTAYFDRKVWENTSETGFVYDQLLSLVAIPIPGFPQASLPLPIPSALTQYESYQRLVEDLRFVSTQWGPAQLVAGVFYYDQHGATPGFPDYPPALTPGFGAIMNGAYGGLGTCTVLGFCTDPANPDEIFGDTAHSDVTEIAGYAQLSYDITHKLKGILGLRYSRVRTTDSINMQGAVEQQPGSAVGLSYPPETITENKTTPKIALQYQITPSLMTYVSAAEGFRPGGQNVPVPGAFCGRDMPPGVNVNDTRFYKSDYLWDYELGAKSGWLHNRLVLNGTVYDMQWKNIQQDVLLLCGFRYWANAGAARSRGAELEVDARPVEPLQLSLGVGYENAVITQSAPFAPMRVGDPVYQVPDWTGNLSAVWTQPITTEMTVVTSLDYSYTGRSFSGNNLTPGPGGVMQTRERPAYRLMDARIALDRGRWEVALVGKNITNEIANLSDVRTIGAEIPGRPRLFVNRPRTVEIEARLYF